jgi:hypothetical protein
MGSQVISDQVSTSNFFFNYFIFIILFKRYKYHCSCGSTEDTFLSILYHRIQSRM